MKFERITVNPKQMGGVPCVRGLRIPVATVVGMVAAGMTTPEILAAYPDLEPPDISEALLYAAEAVRERELPLADLPAIEQFLERGAIVVFDDARVRVRTLPVGKEG